MLRDSTIGGQYYNLAALNRRIGKYTFFYIITMSINKRLYILYLRVLIKDINSYKSLLTLFYLIFIIRLS
jgi:hypothetical protein